MIKCPSCGAELKFNAKSQLVTCEYCKSKFKPSELKVKVKKSQEIDSKDVYEGKSYLCSQCGARLLTFDETAITFCSYCGSQAMIESKMIKKNNPDLIIPFKKSKEEIIEAYRKKLTRSFFAPSYMKSDILVSKFRGIYIPYCIYKASHHGSTTNHGSKYKCRRGDYVYYNDYNINATVDAEYDGISYDLVSNFYDKFSHSIPHNYKEVEKFNANYLAGFYADTSDVEDSIYERAAEQIARSDSTNRMKKNGKFSKYGCSNPQVSMHISEKKVGMFPLYFLAIRNKKNTRVNYAVVNGQTGKVAVDLPIDFKKYILISLLMAVVIFALINSSLVIVPKSICIFSIVVSIISIIISIYQSKQIEKRDKHLDDIGYMYTRPKDEVIKKRTKKENKNNKLVKRFFVIAILIIIISNFPIVLFLGPPILSIGLISYLITKSMKKTYSPEKKVELDKESIFKHIYKMILAIVIGLIVLAINFVNDIYYYGAAIVSFLLIIWSFYDLVNQHNMLVSTKLPQLEKRGGDENE